MATTEGAPAWQMAAWLNTPEPIDIESMRGRVVLAVAFQMLCPGCVSHGLPQAGRARQVFAEKDLAVVGLHTVFEHHEAQGSVAALKAFLHEYRIDFPIGLDARDDGEDLPRTMRAYRMRGTPTTLIYDRAGRLRYHQFGQVEDMRLGAVLASLIAEPFAELPKTTSRSGGAGAAADCADGVCEIPQAKGKT